MCIIKNIGKKVQCSCELVYNLIEKVLRILIYIVIVFKCPLGNGVRNKYHKKIRGIYSDNFRNKKITRLN